METTSSARPRLFATPTHVDQHPDELLILIVEGLNRRALQRSNGRPRRSGSRAPRWSKGIRSRLVRWTQVAATRRDRELV